MAIGILYESKEWSSYALRDNIAAMGVTARLIDMQEDIDEDELLSFDLILNRVFASSVFRDHQKSLDRMPGIIELLRSRNIPMINPYKAHFYEISKELSTSTLARHGFPVPEVYCVFTPAQISGSAIIQGSASALAQTPGSALIPGSGSALTQTSASALAQIKYPCIVKPDCGGRTNCTFIVLDVDHLAQCMKNVPDIKFIAEEYIRPGYGYLTRIEVIGGSCKLILKRSVTEGGLSAYHLGSVYEAYEDCNDEIRLAAVKAMDLLQIETGSMDIIENTGGFYIIDINSVSNASEDNIEMFDFDLMKETAAYAVKRYRELTTRYNGDRLKRTVVGKNGS